MSAKSKFVRSEYLVCSGSVVRAGARVDARVLFEGDMADGRRVPKERSGGRIGADRGRFPLGEAFEDRRSLEGARCASEFSSEDIGVLGRNSGAAGGEEGSNLVLDDGNDRSTTQYDSPEGQILAGEASLSRVTGMIPSTVWQIDRGEDEVSGMAELFDDQY